jgi:hypothetical protein
MPGITNGPAPDTTGTIIPYNAVFDRKNEALSLENAYLWND